MPKGKVSPIWEYFEVDEADEATAICKVPGCKDRKVGRGNKETKKYNTTNLISHLKKHRVDYEKYCALKSAKESKEKRKRDEAEDDGEEGDDEEQMESTSSGRLRSKKDRETFLKKQSSLLGYITSTGDPTSSFRPSLNSDKYPRNDPRAKDRDRGILMMMCQDLRPYDVVNSPGFLYYSHVMDPHFEVRDDTYYRRVVNKVYTNSVGKVEEKLRQDNPSFISAQLDGWSANSNSYIGTIINYLNDDWKRVNISLGISKLNESHTGENMWNHLAETLQDWKVLDKTKVLISDSASNMLKMLEFAPPDVDLIRCLNHILNTIVRDELLKGPQVKGLISNVRDVTNYSHRSTLFAEDLRKRMESLGWEDKALIQDVVTRWNSSYDMLDRFLDLYEAVKKSLEDGWSERIKDGKIIKFSDANIKLVRTLTNTLGGFKDATLKLSRESACVSEYIPTVTVLMKTLEPSNTENDHGVKDLKRRLHSNFEARMDKMQIEEKESLALATLLDPRYKNSYFRLVSQGNK